MRAIGDIVESCKSRPEDFENSTPSTSCTVGIHPIGESSWYEVIRRSELGAIRKSS